MQVLAIYGYSQARLIELGLSTTHALVLAHFVDVIRAGELKGRYIGTDTLYHEVNYTAFLEDLPILGVKKQRLAMFFKDLVNAGVLKHFHLKEGGSFSLYALGREFYSLREF